jgi:hypothetical protein
VSDGAVRPFDQFFGAVAESSCRPDFRHTARPGRFQDDLPACVKAADQIATDVAS